jgi:tetratricopeptide (TPR) repeat protein
LAADLTGEVRERCGGNPLFVEEFVRYLAEARPAAAESATAGVPKTLEALIAARLDVLGDDVRTLLSDGAVMGQEFWRGALAAMEASFIDDIDDALQVLTDRELVRRLPVSSVSGEPEYVFHHAMVRDVAYARLPRAVRAAKHAQVAEWFEAALGHRPDELTGALAHHWVTALELSRAARDDGLAAASLGPAIRSLVRAGDHALALDVSIAESQYGRALELAGPDDPQRPELLVRWARALLEAGRISESIGVFDEAVAGLRRHDDAAATALALSDYSNALQLLGDMRGSQDLLEEALALLTDDRSVARAQVLARWSLHSTIMADDDAAIRAADGALELAEELGLDAPVRALISRAAYRCARCDERGFDDYAAALEVAVRQGLGREVGVIHFDWAEDEGICRGPRAGLPLYREGLRLAESRKDRAMSFSLRYGIVRDLYRAGDWDAALAQAQELAPQLRRADNLAELGYLAAVEGSLLVERGDAAAAELLLPVLEETASGQGEPLLRAECLVTGAAVLRMIGDDGRAHARLSECAELPELAEEYIFDWSLPRAVRLALTLDDVRLAEAFLVLGKPGRPLYRRVWPCLEAQLRERRGDHEAAARLYGEAAAGWTEMHVLYEAALAGLGRGRCLLVLGRAEDAAPVLDRAAVTLSRLRAHPASEEALDLIRRCGEPD